MIYDRHTEGALRDPQVGLGSLEVNDVRQFVTPSQTYQNALMGLGGYSALSRVGKGRGLMSAVGALGGLHTAGMADATFNPASATAQTQVDTKWLGNARLNDILEQPYSFRRGISMLKRSSMMTDSRMSMTSRMFLGGAGGLAGGGLATLGGLEGTDRNMASWGGALAMGGLLPSAWNRTRFAKRPRLRGYWYDGATKGGDKTSQVLLPEDPPVNLDDLPEEVIKYSCAQSSQLRAALRAAETHEAATRGQYTFKARRVPGVKLSAGKIVISSPMEKVSNLGALFREMQGQSPYPLPGISTPGIISDAWAKRPEWLGGPTKAERTIGALKDLVVRDELVFNASGVPVGRKKVLLPGMSGKLLRVPLALGGLMAINAGYNAYQDAKHRATKTHRYAQAMGELRSNEGTFGGFGDILDPRNVNPEDPDSVEEHRRAKQLTRTSFDILDRYAPSVAENPQLAAGYMQGFLFGGGDNMGVLTPDQYMAQVQNAVQLQNSIDQRGSSSVFDGLGSMVGRLIDPE